jgi:hypothetical protein
MNTPLIGNAFALRFDTRSDAIGQLAGVDGEMLMERLVNRGFIAFSLEWESAFEAQLAIEDDVIFICDAVDDLDGFATGTGEHYVHLGDGELEVTSTLSNGIVYTRVDHTPHLDERFRRKYEFESTLQRYISAWHALLAALKSMAE